MHLWNSNLEITLSLRKSMNMSLYVNSHFGMLNTVYRSSWFRMILVDCVLDTLGWIWMLMKHLTAVSFWPMY